jgi:hypothetical protein
MKPCNKMNFHPAAMYYCPINNNPQANSGNPCAVDYAYGIKSQSGGGKNHACSPNDNPSLSQLAWENRYKKLLAQNGGGYYLAVAKPPIGGRSAIGTYPNCCPPVFCGNLTGGSKKKMNKYHRIGYSIFETDKLLFHLKKNDLNKIINKLSLSNKTLVEYTKHFDKNVLRTLASTLLIDTYVNKNKKLNNKLFVKSLNNLIGNNNKFNSVISYLNDIVVNKKNIRELHQKGGYSSTLYPLGYYISPIGANMFTAAAILFFMNMLYKLNNKKNTQSAGGMKLSKKEVVGKISDLIRSIHKLKFTKKNIEKLGDVSLTIKKKIKISKKKAKKHYEGKGGYAPVDYNNNQLLKYNFNISDKLENTKISQENIGDFLKKNVIAGI